MVTNMFSHDIGYEDHTAKITKQDFYGNDGVCLFKYFVHKDDPQKEFVWAILVVNFVCFMSISISYIVIGVLSKNSSKNVANAQNNNVIYERNRKMNRSIAIIITTDFCCWVPFIVICSLHFLEFFDATPWYGIFSMIVLPINSVINPFLYDDVIMVLVRKIIRSISTNVTNSTIYQNYMTSLYAPHPQVIEMEQIHIQNNGNRSSAVGCQARNIDILKIQKNN
jgi:hypothetical protein